MNLLHLPQEQEEDVRRRGEQKPQLSFLLVCFLKLNSYLIPIYWVLIRSNVQLLLTQNAS